MGTRIIEVPHVRLESLHTRTLLRAAEILGGVTSLAKFLHATPANVLLWMLGDADLPQNIFLLAVDVVLADNIRGLSRPVEANSSPVPDAHIH
jgi:hypothetical protein